jgi:ribosomal protein S18 acetylase RimI-like enzyme
MISIRKSTPQDIGVLAAFQQALAAESENVNLDIPTVKKGLQALFDDPGKGVYYVAQLKGEIVGCHLITYEWSDWRNGMVWWLQSVYVLPAHRKSGVFRAMYDNLMNLISADPNLIGLRLYVDKTNQKAQHIYEAIGMNGDHYTVYEWMKG